MPKVLAFYLPQFHPIAENNTWWGEGFTEWDNVRSAEGLFEGHYQPHVPHSSVGYYDLRDKAFLLRQHQTARAFGLHGFCYYYYFFNGKTLLETPLKIIRHCPEIPTNYCLCWANGDWTRAWYGQNKQILISNSYSMENLVRFMDAVSVYFSDARYITIEGKPMLLVYEPERLPDPLAATSLWRAHAQSQGYPDLYLVAVEAMRYGVNPRSFGFDAAVEFAPDWTCVHQLSPRSNAHRIFDYKQTAQNMLFKPAPDYTRFPGVFPSWDNTPRYKSAAITFVNASPGLFKFFLEKTVEKAMWLPEDRQFLFINAWNEWGEGCHLEADKKYGDAWLRAMQQALSTEAARP